MPSLLRDDLQTQTAGRRDHDSERVEERRSPSDTRPPGGCAASPPLDATLPPRRSVDARPLRGRERSLRRGSSILVDAPRHRHRSVMVVGRSPRRGRARCSRRPRRPSGGSRSSPRRRRPSRASRAARCARNSQRNGTKWTADDGEKRAATTLSGWSCPRRRHDAARREGRDAMIDARRAAPSADGRYRFARAPHLERVEEGHREFEDGVEVRRELVLVVLHLCREQDVSSKGLRA